jgi:GNAT superfamily N-acetyltransferase
MAPFWRKQRISVAKSASIEQERFCHSSHRGKGMGRAVFTAAVKELSDRGIPTIGLNVSPSNEPVRGLYQSLGFLDYCT